MWHSSHAREGSTREACEKAKVGKGISLDPGGTRERHPGDHGATSEATKGVMPCGERGSPFVAGHKNLAFHIRLDPDGAVTVRLIGCA